MNALRALLAADLRSIGRDSLLRWMLLMPVVLALFLRWLLPVAAPALAREGVALADYHPLVFSYFFILLVPVMFGTVTGFVLLDERDSDTLTAVRVTPLSLGRYLMYRVLFGIVFSVLMLFAVVPLSGFGGYLALRLLPVALVGSLVAPFFGLLIIAFAANKVEGFAVAKFAGVFLVAPVAAWFVSGPWQILFGVFPTYWPVKSFWLLTAGETYGGYLSAGAGYLLLLVALLVTRFYRVVQR